MFLKTITTVQEIRRRNGWPSWRNAAPLGVELPRPATGLSRSTPPPREGRREGARSASHKALPPLPQPALLPCLVSPQKVLPASCDFHEYTSDSVKFIGLLYRCWFFSFLILWCCFLSLVYKKKRMVFHVSYHLIKQQMNITTMTTTTTTRQRGGAPKNKQVVGKRSDC